MHPRRLRCSSLKYSRYSRSSRLAGGAPRPSRCDARLSPRAVNLRVPRVLRGGEVAFRGGAVVGGTIPDENGFNLRVPRVLRGGEVIMPRGGDVVTRGGELITIVLQAARLPSDS